MKLLSRMMKKAPSTGPTRVRGSAEDNHQHDFRRNNNAGGLGADKPPIISKEHAREARKASRQDERNIFMKPDIVAERIHPRLAVLHAAQRAAEGRTQNCAHQHERNHECREGEHVKGGSARQIDAGNRQCRTWDAAQSVVAAGEITPGECNAPGDLRQRERNHEKVDATRAQRQQAKGGTQCDAHDKAAGEAGPEIRRHPDGHESGRVGTRREVGRVAQRRQAGIAEQQVEAERENREHQALDQQPGIVRGQPGAGDRDSNARDEAEPPERPPERSLPGVRHVQTAPWAEWRA